MPTSSNPPPGRRLRRWSKPRTKGMPPRRSHPRAVRTGETVPVGDASWQEVTNARQVTDLSSRFGESKQGKYAAVGLDFINEGGDEVVTLSAEPVVLSDN